MGRPRKLIGPMSLVWVLGVCVASVLFVAGALQLGSAVAEWTDSEVAEVLFLPVSLLLGVAAWMPVLALAWRVRRKYLLRVGQAVSAVVVESDLRRRHNRAFFDFDLWRVRVEAEFRHPATGDEVRVKKEYFYQEFRSGRARALAERFGAGAAVPVVVHKNAALIDIPKRPIWADIW